MREVVGSPWGDFHLEPLQHPQFLRRIMWGRCGKYTAGNLYGAGRVLTGQQNRTRSLPTSLLTGIWFCSRKAKLQFKQYAARHFVLYRLATLLLHTIHANSLVIVKPYLSLDRPLCINQNLRLNIITATYQTLQSYLRNTRLLTRHSNCKVHSHHFRVNLRFGPTVASSMRLWFLSAKLYTFYNSVNGFFQSEW